jgi:flavin-dependent dehydrogenase
MSRQIDVLIVGGGLAGLTSAIHLSRAGKQVLLIEKNSYPQHKVCGEYLSKEVLPYLNWLGANLDALRPADINKLQITTVSGQSCSTTLPLGGVGISRFALDEYLYQHAIDSGCTVIQDTVIEVSFKGNGFTVRTPNEEYAAQLVLGAYGKRSALDQKLARGFIQNRSPWLAVKAHYTGSFPDDLVALHNFKGGYCGISKVEGNLINICYLADYASFKSYKNIEVYQQQVLFKNTHIKEVMENSSMHFDEPMSISQVSFEKKEKVKDHILMIGDTAGLIHPLCGNGMGMAIHSAQICCTLVLSYLDGHISGREKLEQAYQEHWKNEFKQRVWMGRNLASILRTERYADLVMKGLVRFPKLLAPMIRMTHGKPLIAG